VYDQLRKKVVSSVPSQPIKRDQHRHVTSHILVVAEAIHIFGQRNRDACEISPLYSDAARTVCLGKEREEERSDGEVSSQQLGAPAILLIPVPKPPHLSPATITHSFGTVEKRSDRHQVSRRFFEPQKKCHLTHICLSCSSMLYPVVPSLPKPFVQPCSSSYTAKSAKTSVNPTVSRSDALTMESLLETGCASIGQSPFVGQNWWRPWIGQQWDSA
jgi:hypothetical protein